MTFHRSLLLLPALALAACATATPTPSAKTAVDDQTVVATADSKGGQKKEEEICTTERITGSNLPRRVCRTQSQIDREKEQAEQQITKTRLGPRPGRF